MEKRGECAVKTETRKDRNRTYLIIENGEIYKEDYRFRMILSNDIKGILSCSVRCMDGKARFYYDITEMKTLREHLGREGLSSDLMMKLIGDIGKIEEECEDYLLGAEGILFSSDYIFLDSEGFRFCYLPSDNTEIRESLEDLFQELLPLSELAGKDTIMVCYGILSELRKKTPIADILQQMVREETVDFGEVSRGEPFEKKPVLEAQEENIPEAIPEKSKLAMIRRGALCLACAAVISYLVFSGRAMVFGFLSIAAALLITGYLGETIYEKLGKIKRKREVVEMWEEELPEEDPGTVFLGNVEKLPDETIRGFSLLKTGSYERLNVDKTPFVIGSSESASDGIIYNPAVSRTHARFEQLAGTWFVEDLESTNGTFVNGRRLKRGEKEEVERGEVITFAIEEYEVGYSVTRVNRE